MDDTSDVGERIPDTAWVRFAAGERYVERDLSGMLMCVE